jgi:hypothetical protein
LPPEVIIRTAAVLLSASKKIRQREKNALNTRVKLLSYSGDASYISL